MGSEFLLIIENPLLWGLAALALLYLVFRILLGRRRFRDHVKRLKGEGLLRAQHAVLTRIKFPLLRRITFTHLYLSKDRFMLFHFLTRKMLLQAPVGPRGAPGKEEGRFEIENRGGTKILTFRTPIRGGGRIRFHVRDAPGWLDDIIAH
jgi:hypothetical protein